ncbi:YlbG family protein [Staphylococcus massiliensis]|uniref:Uncharacterized protein n=1 Tax=Staphylococcus massiliensis S46 TaxID=1229783 RepID=K9AJB0_9STAP|nr:YlbG family protein [Staphylococcus massiliensis]EKU46186.1 hypothetical protein C273_09754 [Staphylococcus massiliensis S46]
MKLVQRENLIVFLKNMKHERQLRKYGHINYINKQKKYLSIYVNQDEVDTIVHKLMRLKYVKHIEGSSYKNLKQMYSKETKPNYL